MMYWNTARRPKARNTMAMTVKNVPNIRFGSRSYMAMRETIG